MYLEYNTGNYLTRKNHLYKDKDDNELDRQISFYFMIGFVILFVDLIFYFLLKIMVVFSFSFFFDEAKGYFRKYITEVSK